MGRRACLLFLALVLNVLVPGESQMMGGDMRKGSTPTPSGSLNSLFGHPDPAPVLPVSASTATGLRGGNRIDIQKIMDVPDKEKSNKPKTKSPLPANTNGTAGPTKFSNALASLTGKDKVIKPVNPLEELTKSLNSEHARLPKAHAVDEPPGGPDPSGESPKNLGKGDPAWNFLKQEIKQEENKGTPQQTPQVPSILVGGGGGRPQLQSNVPQAGSSAGTENRPSAPSQGRNAPSSDARGAATEGKPSAPSQPARSSPSGEKVPPKLTDTKGIANEFSRLAGRL